MGTDLLNPFDCLLAYTIDKTNIDTDNQAGEFLGETMGFPDLDRPRIASMRTPGTLRALQMTRAERGAFVLGRFRVYGSPHYMNPLSILSTVWRGTFNLFDKHVKGRFVVSNVFFFFNMGSMPKNMANICNYQTSKGSEITSSHL